DDSDLVIVFKHAVGELIEYLTDANHAMFCELGSSQRAHARSPVQGATAGKHPQRFLVPHREPVLEVSVNDSDESRAASPSAVDVSALHGSKERRFGEQALTFGG